MKGPRKKIILIAHILLSAIMVGNMATFLILSITTVTTKDPSIVKGSYTVMNILAHTSIRASTIGATVTGIILSVTSYYGLFTFWWVMVKEVLTVMLIGINLWGIYTWTLTGLETQQSLALWFGIIIQLISLVFMFVISKYKPWGKRKVMKK
jgi:hypothetical protein